MKGELLLLALMSSTALLAQQAPLPVNEEPNHKPVFKNDYVEVLHVLLQPGHSTLFHTHSHDGVAVHFTEAELRVDIQGKPSIGPRQVKVGDVSAQAYAANPFTHRVNNVGKTPFDVIDIEFLKRPDGPATKPISRPAAENDSARVYKWELGPGASSPEHTHERPYVIIAVTPMELLMTAPGGGSFEHAVVPADLHYIDQKVTHTLTNHGNKAGIIVEVELK